MMNLIILGLSLLADLTGFSSSINYQTTDAHIVDALNKSGITINQDGISEYIERYGDVYNLSGQNKYIEIELSNGYWMLYDKSIETIIDYRNNNPFVEANVETLKLFDEENLGFNYAYYDESVDEFISLGRNVFNNDIVTSYFANKNRSGGNYYDNIPISDDAHVISNYIYFQNLTNAHAWNFLGTSMIVSTEIILGYYDTFESDLFVDESYEFISKQNINDENLSWIDFSESPGADNYQYDDHDFHDYLVDIAKNEIHDNPEQNGMTTKNQIGLVNYYLQKQGIAYSLNTSEGNLGDILTQRAIGIIKSGIDAGRPVIANGTGHSTVAYAYDDEYVWVHTGRGKTGATPWETYESGLLSNYSVGCIDILYQGEHIHSDNYYSSLTNEYICPCGTKYATSSILPEDYGFEAEYFFYAKSKIVLLDNLTININRLRVGYIEEEYINLSPKRENAGEAYFELNFSKPVRKFSINLSYWQIMDVLSCLDSTAVLEVKRDNVWYFEEDLLTLNLSTDRTKQDEFIYSYVGEEIDGLAIRMTSPATGDRNLGRISIGNLILIHKI